LARSNINRLAWAAFIVVCVVWGTTYLAIRVAVRSIPPFLLTGIRFTLAGLILLVVAGVLGDRMPRSRRTLIELLVVGVLLITIGNFVVVWAEQWVPSGLAALFVATAPFWMALIERLHKDGDRLDRRRAFGMLLGFAGVTMLVMPGGESGRFDRQFVLGALGIQGGCVAWQYGTLRAKYYLADVPPLMSSAMQMLFGGIVTGAIGLALGETGRLRFASEGVMALGYLIVFGAVLAYSAYVYAIRHMPTTNMSLYAYVNPVVAVILGSLLLHERLTVLSVAAMVIILVGVGMVQKWAH